MKRASSLVAVATILLSLVSAISVAADQRYRLSPIVIDPSTYPETPSQLVVGDLNNWGHVIGTTANAPPRAFVWRKGRYIDISDAIDPESPFLDARAINDRREVVGSYVKGSNLYGFLLSRNAVTQIIPRAEDTAVFLYGINNRRQVIGDSMDLNGSGGSFVWENGTATFLQAADGGAYVTLSALNNRGTITGLSDTPAGERAAVWRHGTVRLIPPIQNATRSFGRDINDVGQVVGEVAIGGASYAFLWRGKRVVLLAPAPGQSEAVATSINDFGAVTGFSYTNGYAPIATIWRHGLATDLNTLISDVDPLRSFVTLQSASAINDRGQLIAFGFDSRTSLSFAYLLSPFLE